MTSVVVAEVLLALALAAAAVQFWHRGNPAGGLPDIDGRWWAASVAVATVAGALLLDVVRRTVAAGQRESDVTAGRHRSSSARKADWGS